MNYKDINKYHRRICIVSLISPLLAAVSVLCCITGIITIILRVKKISTTLPCVWLLTAGFFVAVTLTIFFKRRTLPSRKQITSLIDSHEQCGGLLMAQGIAGSKVWQPQEPSLPLKISWSNPPALITLLATLLFLMLSIYLPMPKTMQEPGSLQLGQALNKIEEQIDTLDSLDMLEEERAEIFRKELDSLEQSKNAENPATTWEALDQLTESITSKANEEIEDLQNKLTQQSAMNEVVDAVVEKWNESDSGSDQAAMAAAELADLINSDALTPELSRFMQQSLQGLSSSNSLSSTSLTKEDLQKLSEALNSLSAEEMAKLQELFAQGLMNSSQMQSCQNARMLSAEEIREMLKKQCQGSSCKSGCTNLSACVAASMLCQGSCPGSSGKPGHGGISRGPGHAPLEFSGNTEEDDFLFKLQALPKGSPQFKQNKLIGLSAAAPQVNTDKSQSSGSAIQSQNTEGAAAISSTLLPQHRRVVQNYFSRDKPPNAERQPK